MTNHTPRNCRAEHPATCRYHGWIDNMTFNMMTGEQRANLEQRMRLTCLGHLYIAGLDDADIVAATMPDEWAQIPAPSLVLQLIPTSRLRGLAVKRGILPALGATA